MGKSYYYDVIPATSKFRGKNPLTYVCKNILSPGQIVLVDFRGSEVCGVIVSAGQKPNVKEVKDIKRLGDIQLPPELLTLMNKSLAYYPGYMGATAQLFAPSYLKNIDKLKIKKLPKNEPNDPSDLPKLTAEQKNVHARISGKGSTFLLHGDTGTGKTRVYLELSKDMLSKNKSVLVLTPEISLTKPLENQFKNAFGDAVSIIHSSLTPKKKVEIWNKLSTSKDPTILVGPRSALFMPIKNLGLIVVDEFHESAYKQDSAPFYNAIRIASILSQISGAKLVLGSATPSINEYFLAKSKNIPILNMDKQAITGAKRQYESKIINLSDKSERSDTPMISKTLLSMMREELESGRQALLFINKRGSARTISCENCGWRYLCPNCDLPLVYHSDENLVRCHTCGFKNRPVYTCPECKSSNVMFKNPGTKTIVENLSKVFPNYNIVRFDRDNKKSERLENNYESLESGNANIIVGTQILTKGHDLPKLGLVAMLQADSSLNFPDFTSEEKSFQLIRQLSGRVGRGHNSGKVVIQTFAPDSTLVKMALEGSWDDFYENQIQQRQKLGFPPFYHAVKIETSRKKRDSAEKSIKDLAEKIESTYSGVTILGPSPSFIEKRLGSYNWQIIVKSKNRNTLSQILDNIDGFRANIDPLDFL